MFNRTTSSSPSFWILIFAAALIPVLATGCKPSQASLQYDDARNPLIQKAESATADHNPDGAIVAYQDALRSNPNLPDAHRQLGLLYSDAKRDPVRAIYHFTEYLDLRPTGEHRDEVQKLLDRESLNFAASLANSPVQNAEVMAAIQSENASLKQQLQASIKSTSELEKALGSQPHSAMPASAPVTAPVTSPVASTGQSMAASQSAAELSSVPATPAPAVAAPAPVSTGAAHTHTIQAGDSLWKISSTYYRGDVKNGVERIKQANPQVLVEGKPLKIGTVLTIP